MIGTPTLKHSNDTSLNTLIQELEKLSLSGKKSACIFSTTQNEYDATQLGAYLTVCPMTIFGGVFTNIIHSGAVSKQGFVIAAYDTDFSVSVFADLDKEIDNADFLSGHPTLINNQRFLILIDGLSPQVDNFIHTLYQNLGSGISVIGGGAGSLDFIQKPCLFSNQGMLENAALVITLPDVLTTATGHGWEIADGPYLVTESKQHKLITMNYQPAFEVYSEVVNGLSGEKITEKNFFEIAKYFPLGIAEIGDSLLVRDPIVCDEQTITCVGDLPTNSTVYVLRADSEKLIDGAQTAANEMIHSYCTEQKQDPHSVMLFDCVSRLMYLGDQFNDELNAVSNTIPKNSSTIGALSLGELSNSQGGPIQLLNKSFVSGCF